MIIKLSILLILTLITACALTLFIILILSCTVKPTYIEFEGTRNNISDISGNSIYPGRKLIVSYNDPREIIIITFKSRKYE